MGHNNSDESDDYRRNFEGGDGGQADLSKNIFFFWREERVGRQWGF